jgi:lysozyme
MTLPGIDLSDFQPLSRGEWTMLAGQGLRFAFVKASEGKSFQAETFEAKWHDSKAAGLLRGVYHFFRPSRTGEELRLDVVNAWAFGR